MTIAPINQRRPACFGVCCELHARCERYAAVETATSEADVIATCEDRGGRPLFVELQAEEA